MNLQHFGGRGGAGGKRTGNSGKFNASAIVNSPDFVGDRSLREQANDFLRHHLGENESYADVESYEIISNPGNGYMGDVEVEYSVDVRIPVGRDPETGREEYETDTEYRKTTLQLRLRK